MDQPSSGIKRWIQQCKDRLSALPMTGKIILAMLGMIYLPVLLVSFFWYQHAFNISRSNLYNKIDSISSILVSEYNGKVSEMHVLSDIVGNNATLARFLEESPLQDDFRNYLTLTEELGPFLTNILQFNNTLESIRIWGLQTGTPRYQNIIYPFDALKGDTLYETLQHLPYGGSLFMTSNMLYAYQNPRNSFRLFFPMGIKEDIRTFSLFSYVYSSITHQPVGILECVVASDQLLDATGVNLDVEQVFICEEGNGVIYSSNDKDGISAEITRLNLESGLYDHKVSVNGHTYHFFTYPVQEPRVNLIIACSNADIYGQQSREIITFIALLVIFLALFCLFVAWSYRKFFGRLKLLDTKMNELREGNESVTFTDPGNDEIAQINHTLSDLLKTIYTVRLAENEATISYLRAQIEPHFLFNTLDAIRMTAMLGDTEKTSEALMALGTLTRGRIRNTSKSSIFDEVQLAQQYVQLENICYDDRILLQIQVDSGLENLQIPSLTLQPLVENSVRHGMNVDGSPLLIKISVTELPDNQVLLHVADNGTGIAPEQLAEIQQKIDEPSGESDKATTGVALTNIAKRIKLYYGEKAKFSIYSNLGIGTQITLILPKENL